MNKIKYFLKFTGNLYIFLLLGHLFINLPTSKDKSFLLLVSKSSCVANIFPIYVLPRFSDLPLVFLKIDKMLKEAVQFFHISRLLLNLGNSDWHLFQMFFLQCSSAVLLLWNLLIYSSFLSFMSLTLVLLTEGICYRHLH